DLIDTENTEIAPLSSPASQGTTADFSSLIPGEEKQLTDVEEPVVIIEDKATEIKDSDYEVFEAEYLVPTKESETTLNNNSPELVEPELVIIDPEVTSVTDQANLFTPDEVDELLQVDSWTTQRIRNDAVEPITPHQELPTQPERITPEPTEIIRYELEIPEELEESTLDQTLANFDSFLFKPERDEDLPGELKAATNEEFIRDVYLSNQVGYWMGSSRLGEVLQVKDELTRHTPLQFYPDLILEYSKQNYLTPTDPPKTTQVSRQLEIIDQFLKANPKLKTFSNEKLRAEPQDDLAFKSTKNTKNLASENLANILIKQGKLKKAIKIYEHLIVKIPEKKAYFASQIENLRNQL
ncbi:MAG: hypothetical protein M3Q05_00675, partial [Bacteroidota bacterium]|nr:hypothetical protein [Bacteroidota bacterium]